MKNKSLSTNLSKTRDKSLSGWERAIFEAKERIVALKRSIRTFEDLRDGGMPFPEPPATFESEERLLGQK